MRSPFFDAHEIECAEESGDEEEVIEYAEESGDDAQM